MKFRLLSDGTDAPLIFVWLVDRSRVLTSAFTVIRTRSSSVTTGVKWRLTPKGTNVTPWRPAAVKPVTTGTGNCPPTWNDAGRPFMVVRVGEVRERARFNVSRAFTRPPPARR